MSTLHIPKNAAFKIEQGPDIPGFDGHCLRAQSYFAEEMPDIKRVPDGAKCYRATVNGETIYFHSLETVTYLGQPMTGQELWERLSNQQIAA